MDMRMGLARLRGHRAYVGALIEQSGELERRAVAGAAERIREAEAVRRANPGDAVLSSALDAFLDTSRQRLVSVRRLRREMVDTVHSEPDSTAAERRHMRGELEDAVRLLERAAREMEQGLAGEA